MPTCAHLFADDWVTWRDPIEARRRGRFVIRGTNIEPCVSVFRMRI